MSGRAFYRHRDRLQQLVDLARRRELDHARGVRRLRQAAAHAADRRAMVVDAPPQQRIAAQDPHHMRGIRTMEVLEWNPHRAFRLNGPTIADVERMAVGNS